VRDGATVTAFDLGTNHRRLELIMSPDELDRVAFVVGDITDLDTVDGVLTAHDITNVIHLAALQVPFCRADPPLGARVNVVGTVNVFEAVRRRGDGMAPIVYASSIGMYSPRDVDPVSGRLREDAEPHPGNHYGVYKAANEGNAQIYWADAGVASIGFRPMTVFGPGRDQGMTSGPSVAIAATVLGEPYRIAFGGSALFQYAEDVAATFVIASRSGRTGAEVYNLGGSVVSIDDWIGALDALVSGTADRITHEPAPLPFPAEIDHDRLAVLGTVPVTPWRTAMGDMVERYRALAADDRLIARDHGLPVAATV
jgi:nucleoside-diphosphate-sugar epimerase